MRVPASWLREYVEFDVPVPELADRLAIATCEVERISRRGVPDVDGNLGRYVVGRVEQAGKHPNADRLQLCRVDVGEPEPRQIVCGAWNFGPGATVAVALPGAVLPDGRTLERAKLRGSVSDGMILSERELELGADHEGIIVLAAGPEAGTPLADVLPLSEEILELEVTGNRPDLLAVYGIAREVAALFPGRAELRPVPGSEPGRPGDEPVDVRIEDVGAAPRYVGRLFRDVAVAPSPPWLRARLAAAGMRAISNVVDVTNYVMHALGNPLHAFDFDTLRGGRIVVRPAHDGEELRTLDGVERRLDPSVLVIADAERAVALAAIMGGEETEVRDATTSVLLEAANFEPAGILRTSERLSLRTEGSNRWEKGVDPYLAGPAATYATELLVDVAGARWAGATDAHGDLPARPAVRFRPGRANALNGLAVPLDEQGALLERLGFEVAVEGDWTVTVPTWRARDVTREADVVEEIARVHLDEIPFTLPARTAMFGRLTPDQRLRRVVEEALAGAGFDEAYTWSLAADDPRPDALRLPEPLSAEHAVLRTSLLPGLVDAARRNLDAGNERIALFEIARVYLPSGGALPDERRHVGGIAEGGFGQAKGAVETLFAALGAELTVERTQRDELHPGKAAAVPGGWVGELHPSLLEGAWGAFELDLDELEAVVPERRVYEDVITFPALLQDLAFVVDEDVPAGELVAALREAAPEAREARVFDVYRGGQIPEGRKSVALRVAFQSPERTLSDEDAQEIRERIVAALAGRFRAELRA
jgi:phenylalanyl-tRNA synthetase beta chain